MPFTLSHVAAVLPLLRGGRGRGKLVASGLVAGAMAPDVPYYVESLVPGSYRYGGLTHRWWAVPTVDVVIAGAMGAVWHGLVREPLVGLVPPRWAPGGAGTPGVGWFAVSAAIGAATHVGSDAFTHEGRAGVRLLPVLERTVAGRPLCTVLQYGTSLVGLAALADRARRTMGAARTRGPRPSAAARRAGTGALALATAVGAAHRLAGRRRGVIDELCFGAGAGFTAGAIAYAAAVRAVRGVSSARIRAGRTPRRGPCAPAPPGRRSR